MRIYAIIKKKKMEKSFEFRRFGYRACTRPFFAILSMLTVRVVVLEYSQLHKKAYNVSLEALKMY